MSRCLAALAIGSLVAACGGGSASEGTPLTSGPTASVHQTVASTTAPPAPTEPSGPVVLALSTGRGDDGSMEVVAWLGSDPFIVGTRLVVGTDSDDSYPGTGDPEPHLDGRLEVHDGSAVLFDGEGVVAEDEGLSELVSWAYSGGVLRVFFIGDIPTRGGWVWVIVDGNTDPAAGGTAGVSFGDACSYHGSGLDLSGAVENAGRPCRYP